MSARRSRWRAGVLLAVILMLGQSIGLVSPLEEARASSADWVDQTFAPDVVGIVNAVAIQSDGKILIGGTFTSVNGQAAVYLARLNSDGSLDGSFATSVNNGVYEIALQADGKILIGGTFSAVNGQTRRGIARLNADGTVDTSFNANLTHSSRTEQVQVIQPLAGGQTLIGGHFEKVGSQTQAYLARLDAGGSIDSSFRPVLDGNVMAIAVQSDNRFVVGGSFQRVDGVVTGRLARLETNGTRDASFAPGTFSGSGQAAKSLALQPDGKVVVGGVFTDIGSTARNNVARLNTDGSVDSTFNPGANSYVEDMLIQSDGRIIIGGYFDNAGGQARRALARFEADGSLDTDFNPSPNNNVYAIAAQSDGKLIIGGVFLTVGGVPQARLARLEVAASLPGTQPTFDTPVRTADGFTVNVTNYDPAFSWTPTSTAGAVSAGTADDSLLPITVTGLTVGQSATVTVATTQAGFSPGSASVTGQAKSAQSVTWSPATALVLPAGSVTPAPGSTTGDGVLSYSVDDSGTTGCSWDDTSGSLSYAAAGTCRVRVLAAETSDYLDDSIVVDFTVSKGAQSLTWTPVTALTLPAGSVVPTSASALGGATTSYSVDDSGTTGCAWDDTTGSLSYAAVGTCRVRVSAAATADYLDDSMTVDFTVAKGTQAVSWSPPSSLTLASLSVDLGHASTSGDGALRYTVDDPGTTGCAIADDTVPLLTYVSAGTCSVTATALATADYLDDSLTTSISIGLATPTMSWAPITALSLPAATVTPASASTTGDGPITYAVTNAGSTGCSWDDTSGSLSYTGAGSCTVTASSLATSRYAAGSVSATFNVSLGTQVVSWSPTTSLRTPGATVTPPAATTSGDGAISYLVTSAGSTGCTWDDTTATLTYTSAGSCTVRATASATATYASAFTDVTFTIADLAPAPAPAPGPGPVPAPSPLPTPSPSPSPSPSPAPGPSPDPGTDPLPSPGPSPTPGPSPSPDPTPTPNPSPSPLPSPGNGSVVSVEGVRVPVVNAPGMGLPPSPARVQVRSSARKSVRVTLPPRVAGSRVLATVVTVLAPDGQVVARVIVQARAGERTAEVSVPFFAKGYTVRVYTVNAIGVSRGGFVTSPLIHDSTINTTSSRAKPLVGTRLGRPVYFAGGSSWLDRGDRRQLAKIAKAAKAAKAPVFVTGFARKGANTDAVLKRLSTQRARAVAEYLSGRGVRVWIRYWGAGSMGGDGTATDRKVEVRTLTATKTVKAPRTSKPSGPADRGA